MDCIEDSEGTFRIHRELDDFAQDKRFTDAELAAEYWRAKWTGLVHEHKWHSILSDKHRAMIATVERFMDLPHYDQEEDNSMDKDA